MIKTERTAVEIVNQAISDFDNIKEAILGHRIDVPYPTKTSLYGELIAKIRVGCIAGRSSPNTGMFIADTLIGEFLPECRGRTVQPMIGKAYKVAEE